MKGSSIRRKVSELSTRRLQPVLPFLREMAGRCLKSVKSCDRWLIAAVALGIVLGAQGFGWGKYDCLNPDRMALKDVMRHERPPLHPGHFYKPPFYTYINHFLARVPARTATANLFWMPEADRFELYLKLRVVLARFWNLAIFSGCVVLVYRLARDFYGIETGRIGALLFATSAGFVPYQVFLTTDLAVVFMMLASFAGACAISKNPSMGWSVAAGFLAGLAAATKYNGLIVAAALPVAHLIASRGNPFMACLKRPAAWVCGLAVPAGFVLGNPYSLLDPHRFVADFLYNYKVTPVYGGETRASGYETYFHTYFDIFGWPGLYFILAGMAVGLVVVLRSLKTSPAWKLWLLALVVGGLYSWKIGSFPRMEPRFVVPSTPYVLLLGAAGFGAMMKVRWLTVPALACVVVFNLACGWWVGELFRKDPRNEMLEYARAHIPARSIIEVSPSIPRLEDLPGRNFVIIRAPSGVGRWENFSGRFAADEDVMKVVNQRKEPSGLAWFSREARARRNAEWIFWSSNDVENITRGFYDALVNGESGYRVVWDGQSPKLPRWVYPQNPDFLINRSTVLTKNQPSH